MTDLIQEIEKAIIDRAANHTKANIYDEYSSANFEEGALFTLIKILPLLKKCMIQRNEWTEAWYDFNQLEKIKNKIEEENQDLLKLLGSENE